MRFMMRSMFGSTRCPSRPRKCSRRSEKRGREKREESVQRRFRMSHGLSLRASPRRGRVETERPWRRSVLRLPSFRYLQPTSLGEALRMKGDAGADGMFVAGGTDLYPNMKRRHQEPRTVISLMGIPELRADGRMGGSADGMTLGGCVTPSKLSDHPPIPPSPAAT